MSTVDDVVITLKEAVEKLQGAVTTLEKIQSFAAPKEKKPSRREREAAEEIPEKLTKESLGELSYNTLKRLARDKGIKAVGGREDLTKAILERDVTPKEVVEDNDGVAIVNKHKVKPLMKSVKDEEPEPEIEDADDEAEEVVEDNVEDELEVRALALLEDVSNEEIADYLTECGIPAKGKRQALIDSFIKGVEDGVIDLDSLEGEDETDEVVDEEADEDVGLTDKCRAALKDLQESIRAEVESGDISRQQMVEEINRRLGTKSRMTKWSDEEVVDKYIELEEMLIDDDGNLNELEVPYVLRGINYCCGEPLQEVEDGFKCSICGNEYGYGE